MAIYQNVYKAQYPYQIDHQFHPLISAHAVKIHLEDWLARVWPTYPSVLLVNTGYHEVLFRLQILRGLVRGNHGEYTGKSILRGGEEGRGICLA